MSSDTHILLQTSLTASEVKAALLRDPALADLGLKDTGMDGLTSNQVTLLVKPWKEDDRDLIGNGFAVATVRVKVIPRHGPFRFEAEQRAQAAVLRLVPGDACLANQDAAGPGLLRLGEVVYVDPDWVSPENLTGFGYTPNRIVVGIPALAAEAAQ